MSRRLCGRRVVDGLCGYERLPGKQMCMWHWLLRQPADVQATYAAARLHKAPLEHKARVPATEWPDGERWCAGCQSFIPWVYVTGSRCKSCASVASHAGAIERQYGITGEEYDELFRYQGGRCAVCGRKPQKKRLAVDHDHKTGEVRGLLCANNENGCNRAVVANLEGSPLGGLAAARRLVAYLELSPWDRLRGRSGAQEPSVRVDHGLGIIERAEPPF